VSGGDSADRLEALMTRIDHYVRCLPPGIGKLRSAMLKQPVIAKYSSDGKWYRARVTGTAALGLFHRLVAHIIIVIYSFI